MKKSTIFLATLLIGAAGFTMNAQAELAVGDEAPEFSMQGSDGKTHKLSDYKGKQAVVVAWYPKAFTGG
jgi:peroxiredoxin Q/BCP